MARSPASALLLGTARASLVADTGPITSTESFIHTSAEVGGHAAIRRIDSSLGDLAILFVRQKGDSHVRVVEKQEYHNINNCSRQLGAFRHIQ